MFQKEVQDSVGWYDTAVGPSRRRRSSVRSEIERERPRKSEWVPWFLSHELIQCLGWDKMLHVETTFFKHFPIFTFRLSMLNSRLDCQCIAGLTAWQWCHLGTDSGAIWWMAYLCCSDSVSLVPWMSVKPYDAIRLSQILGDDLFTTLIVSSQ